MKLRIALMTLVQKPHRKELVIENHPWFIGNQLLPAVVSLTVNAGKTKPTVMQFSKAT